MKITSVFLSDDDRHRWLAAASIAGMSRSELLRLALREKSAAILNHAVTAANAEKPQQQ